MCPARRHAFSYRIAQLCLDLDELDRVFAGRRSASTAAMTPTAHCRRSAPRVLAVLRGAYGANARLWFERWRLFWVACAEMFGYAHGTEWLIAHYRFTRPAGAARA